MLWQSLNFVVVFATFVAGFVAGLSVYAHIYRDFVSRTEDRVKSQVILNQQRLARERTLVKDKVDAIKARFGPDLSKEHQDIVDEEIERVLGTGPR